MTSVHLRNVSKEYAGGAKALSGIDLEAVEGELLALVGASGSGKTTILRLVAGLESPTGGSIFFGVDDVTAWPPWRRQTALVSEASSLLPHKTAAENLVWSRERRNRSGRGEPWWRAWRRSDRDASRPTRDPFAGEVDAAAWADRLGLSELLERLPQTLSAGQQQRVALGRALLAQPRVLLLDEPLGRLDGPQRVELSRELKRFQRQLGATWIYVTHDRREATSVADRIGVLDEGRLLQVGTPRELGEDPDSLRVAQWMAARPLNVIRGARCDPWRRSETPAAATWRANEGVLVPRRGAERPTSDERIWRAGVVTELEEADGAIWIWVSPAPAAPIDSETDSKTDGECDGDLCVEVSAASASWRRGDEVWAGFERAQARWFESTSGKRLR